MNTKPPSTVVPAEYREPRWDFLLAALAIIASGWLLHSTLSRFASEHLLISRAASNAVATTTVAWKAGWVRYRSTRSLVWLDLGMDVQPLLPGDEIFTAEDGRATLKTPQGEIELEPGTLLVIRDQDQLAGANWGALFRYSPLPPGLEIKRGRVNLTLSASRMPIRIQARNGALTLRTSTNGARVSVDAREVENGGPLRILTPRDATSPLEARAPADSVPRFLGPGQELMISPDGTGLLRDAPPIPASPADNGQIFRDGIEKTAPPSVPPASRHAPVHAPVHAPLPVPPTATETKAAPVPTQIKLLPALEAETVLANTTALTPDDLHKISILLRWKAIADVDNYEIVVRKNDGGILLRRTVTEPKMFLELLSLDTTNYSYQVTAKLNSGTTIQSGLMPIRIELSSATPSEPQDGAWVQTGSATLLTWRRTALTQRYRIQIARDPDFTRPVLDQELSPNLLLYTAVAPGDYFWRVRSLIAGGATQWSRANRMRAR